MLGVSSSTGRQSCRANFSMDSDLELYPFHIARSEKEPGTGFTSTKGEVGHEFRVIRKSRTPGSGANV